MLDSRGFPTVEVELIVEGRYYSRAAVPSGASTGQFEAVEKRDGDPTRYVGKGVQSVVEAIHSTIRPALLMRSCLDQYGLDAMLCKLDGTSDKSRLGANAVLAVSLAAARAGAKVTHQAIYSYLRRFYRAPVEGLLPVPYVNVLNGGKHADNRLDVQEFMLVPRGQNRFSEALRVCCEIFYALKALCHEKGGHTNVGDEGGLAPDLSSTREALDWLTQATERAGYTPGKDVSFALDVAASELFYEGCYHLDGQSYTTEDLIRFYDQLRRDYPIVSLEDGLKDDDWEGWAQLTADLGARVQLVGDDLFVTSCKRLDRGIRERAGNAILIKPNQVGTLTETFETCRLAQENGWGVIISHRSGEVEDAFISELSLAVGCGKIKAGGVSRGERIAKYNKLLRLEEYLGKDGQYAGAL